MSEEKTTPYYLLPLYGEGSMANLRDQYNEAMRILDQRIHILETRITLLENAQKISNND